MYGGDMKTSPGKLLRYFKAWADKDGRQRWGAQKRFADACGVDPGTASLWLSGRRDPGYERLPRIAEVLGVSVSELILKGRK